MSVDGWAKPVRLSSFWKKENRQCSPKLKICQLWGVEDGHKPFVTESLPPPQNVLTDLRPASPGTMAVLDEIIWQKSQKKRLGKGRSEGGARLLLHPRETVAVPARSGLVGSNPKPFPAFLDCEGVVFRAASAGLACQPASCPPSWLAGMAPLAAACRNPESI